MKNEVNLAVKESDLKKDAEPEKPEHPVFEAIKTSKPENAIENCRNFFEIDGVNIEILDNSGMTPLMHACWKGNVALAKFLLEQVKYVLEVAEFQKVVFNIKFSNLHKTIRNFFEIIAVNIKILCL